MGERLTTRRGEAVIDSDDTLLEELISEELAAVIFVRDYVQLQFGSPPTLNAYTPVTVRSQGGASRSGDPGFTQALVAQLDKSVLAARKELSQRLEILFDDTSAIDVSVRSEDYHGPEAFNILERRGPSLSSEADGPSAVGSTKERSHVGVRTELLA